MSSPPRARLRAIQAESIAAIQATDRAKEAYEKFKAEQKAEDKRRRREAARPRQIRRWEKENEMPVGARVRRDSEPSECSSPRRSASDGESEHGEHADSDAGAEQETGIDAEDCEAAYHAALVPHHANDTKAFKAYVEADVDREEKRQFVRDWVRRDAAAAIEEKDAERAGMLQAFANFKATTAAIMGERNDDKSKRTGDESKRKRDDSNDGHVAKRRRVKPELAAGAPERRHHACMGSSAEAALKNNSTFTATTADNTKSTRDGFDKDAVEDSDQAGVVATHDLTKL